MELLWGCGAPAKSAVDAAVGELKHQPRALIDAVPQQPQRSCSTMAWQLVAGRLGGQLAAPELGPLVASQPDPVGDCSSIWRAALFAIVVVPWVTPTSSWSSLYPLWGRQLLRQ